MMGDGWSREKAAGDILGRCANPPPKLAASGGGKRNRLTRGFATAAAVGYGN